MSKTALLLFIVLVLFSCGKKEVKQVSQESKTSDEAFALVETVRNAFIKNDLITLQNSSTEDGYRDITVNKRPFDKVELTFTPRWVEMENNRLLLNISWKGTWISSGKSAADRGMAVFVMEGRPLKVSNILRSNPFIHPEQ